MTETYAGLSNFKFASEVLDFLRLSLKGLSRENMISAASSAVKLQQDWILINAVVVSMSRTHFLTQYLTKPSS